VAYWCRNLLKLLFPAAPGIIVNLPAEIDWRVVGAEHWRLRADDLAGGVGPGNAGEQDDLASAMKSESGSVVEDAEEHLFVQVWCWCRCRLVFVLIVGAGLLFKSLRGMRSVDPGFSTQEVLTTTVDLRAAGYDTQRARNFQDELVDRLQALGGVESAVFSRSCLFSYPSYSAG